MFKNIVQQLKGDVGRKDRWDIFLQPQCSTGYFLTLIKVNCHSYIAYTAEKALLHNLGYKRTK
jgi:hypothetical protein